MRFWNTKEWKGIQKELKKSRRVIPDPHLVFRPLLDTPLNKVKVVFLGSEPWSDLAYESDGLAYSVSGSVETMRDLPKTLLNLLEEAKRTEGIRDPKTGSLRRWAKQGVLLWNTIPTRESGTYPKSHLGMGWYHLTKEILETAYLYNPDVVFVFPSHTHVVYRSLVPADANKIDIADPGNRMFLGCDLFRQINTTLTLTGQKHIDWNVN